MKNLTFKGGVKLVFLIFTFCFIFVGVYYMDSLMNHTLSANSGLGFQLYDKVSITSDTYTVIDTSNNQIKLLCDSNWCITGSTYTFTDTNKYLNGSSSDTYGYNKTAHGYEGSSVLLGKFSIPAKADLANVTTGDTLDARIATSDSGFWLNDDGGTNRKKYVDQNNSFLGENIIKTVKTPIVVNNTKVCEFDETNEQGILPVVAEPDSVTETRTTKKTVKLIASLVSGGNWANVKKYEYSNCTGTSQSNFGAVTSALSVTMDVVNNPGYYSIKQTSGAGPIAAIVSQMSTQKFLSLKKGDTGSYTFPAGTCINLSNTSFAKGSVQMTEGYSGTIKYSVSGDPTSDKINETCSSPNSAGKVSRRPILTLNKSDILAVNQNKRDYTPTGRIDQALPISDADADTEKKYITLLNSDLKVSLKSGATGVNGDTYTILKPEDGIVSLPLSFSGNRDGVGNVVSAIATMDGVERYGILSDIGKATSKDVQINLNDFASDLSTINEIQLKLFQESEGLKQSSFQGEVKEITVKLETPKEQAIAFDGTIPTIASYGDRVQLSAHLISSLRDAANTNIEFSVKSGNAVINTSAYSYDATTGRAVGEIRITSGVGKVVIAINKAGAGNTNAAEEQTIELSLQKRALTIKPTKLNKIFQLNDPMPSITSDYDGLVSGDEAYVSSIVPTLVALSEGTASRPDNGGKVINTGIWKMVYMDGIADGLTDLHKRYNVTLVDYEQDHTLVFETAITDIPDGWIEIDPDATNAKGWNNTSVSVLPSEQAVNSGYDRIEMMNGSDVTAFGSSILFDQDTTGVLPVVRLCKGSICTNAENAPRTIKLDKTPPAATISVDNETGWSAQGKNITIYAQDHTSGLDTNGISAILKGSAVTFTPLWNGSGYNFTANQNGTYVITVSDEAGNTKEIEKTITKIDLSSPTLSAVPQTKPAIPTYQDIDITWTAGDSDLKYFKVYHSQNGNPFVLLETSKPEDASFLYRAEMNGSYKFEITNQANQSVDATVEVSGLTPPYPDTLITAVYQDDSNQSYTDDTWTNHNIELSLSNANDELNIGGVTFTWQMSSDHGNSWTSMGSDTSMSVTTDTLLSATYWFKATAEKDGDTYTETDPAKITVKVDKRKPNTPIITDHAKYTEDTWHQADITLVSTFVPKSNGGGISERIYVCEGTETDCANDDSLWKLTADGTYNVSGNGKHKVYFKVIDEAGNHSDMTLPAYVNINDAQPKISIKFNNDPIRNFLNQMTLGYYFNDVIRVDVETDYGDGVSGNTYIVIDENGTGMPEVNDPEWGSPQSSTTIVPDKKVMVYVLAVSDTGVSVRESSIYDVYADQTKPDITIIGNTGTWTNDTTLETTISDTLSGIDIGTMQYIVDGGDPITFGFDQNDTAVIRNLNEGSYDIVISASDLSGNKQSETASVMIDRTKPVIGEPQSPMGNDRQKTVIFTATDTLSNIDTDRINVTKKSDGTAVEVKQSTTQGEYTFVADTNDTYFIHVYDHAGNESIREYTETRLDTTPPLITDIEMEREHDWTINKQISFKVTDTQSGVDTSEVKVSIQENGEIKYVAVSGPDTEDKYTFTANTNGIYTIHAQDHAGNQTTETVEVGNIDPDGLKIINISDITAWTKDEMTVSFEVRTSTSTLVSGYPKVTRAGMAIPVSMNNNRYEFIADENEEYLIEVQNTIGDQVIEKLQISHIDILPPSITDVSENTTDTGWREPQIITFHVYDYNHINQSTTGSGLKSGYPKIYYMKSGVREDVTLTQDATDISKYRFLADRNTIYYAEAMDAVEHEIVTEEIPVDHIMDPDQLSDLVVTAENNGNQINSGTWINGTLEFTISGGLDSSVLETYQVAITNGNIPSDDDFADVNNGTDSHIVTGDVNGDTYWFRAYPVVNQVISRPFVVKADNTKPENVTIHKTKKNTSGIAQLIYAITFGNWMKETQEITFSATDNFTSAKDMKYLYAEEKNGVLSQWFPYTEPLIYENTDVTLYVKAIDQAGNESDPLKEALQIDTKPPLITGVQDQKEYKQYYLPRYVTVTDVPADGSGLASAMYSKDGSHAGTFIEGTVSAITGQGTYIITAQDNAGNETILTFKIIPMPSLEDIDGSDEAKAIIDQIQKELDEIKEHLKEDEIGDYEQWITDATEKWEASRKKVIEHEETASKIEGIGNTSFDPKTELIVEDIEETQIPTLPKKAISIYDVYLEKAGNKVEPNGEIKVYLPYREEEEPIVYQIDDNGNVTRINAVKENGYVTFITNSLKKYAISNTAQDDLIDNDNCNNGVCGNGSDTEEPEKKPDGSIEVPPSGNITFPNGNEIEAPDGGIIHPDGSVTLPDGTEYDKNGTQKGPKQCPAHINKDSDGDGKHDINIDLSGDCVAELNVDTNNDGIPDINIDTKGDGNPHYNIDTNNDGKADLNIGPIPKPWKPNLCVTVNKVAYCTMKDLIPEVNIDTDGDGKADINIDTDGDGKPDINIDIDGDGKPDLNIDTNGDGKPDKNIDANGNGIIDDDEQEQTTITDGGGTTTTQSTYHNNQNAIGGASTYDSTNPMMLLLGILITGASMILMKKQFYDK